MSAKYPNDGALWLGAKVQTALAASKLHLFKSSFTPNNESVIADFDAAECDYDGYAAGGIAVATWLAPLLTPPQGCEIESGTKQFHYVDGVGHVTNLAGGWYLTDTGGALVAYDVFPEAVPFQSNGNGLNLDIVLPFGQ